MRKNERILSAMLIKQTDLLWKSTLSARLSDIYPQIKHYEPGDWIVMKFVLPEERFDRLGRLILECDERIDTAIWHFFYIEMIDGKLVKWSSVEPLRVLPLIEPSAEEKAAWVEEAKKRHGLQEETV